MYFNQLFINQSIVINVFIIALIALVPLRANFADIANNDNQLGVSVEECESDTRPRHILLAISGAQFGRLERKERFQWLLREMGDTNAPMWSGYSFLSQKKSVSHRSFAKFKSRLKLRSLRFVLKFFRQVLDEGVN